MVARTTGRRAAFAGLAARLEPLKERARGAAGRGALWTIFGFGSGQVLRLASSLILTRLLYPEAFGLIALASVFITGLEMLSDTGIRQWLIRHPKGEDPVVLDTAWTVQVVRGLILFLCALSIAVPVSRIYNQPELALLIPGIATAAVIAGFNSLALPLASRRMQFGKVTLIGLVASLSGLIGTAVLALFYKTPLVLIGSTIISSTLTMLASHFVLDSSRRHFRVNREVLKEFLTFGKWIFLSSMIFFFASQGDRMLLGHYMPMAILASYGIADQLSRLPRTVVDTLTGNVGFPLFSRTNQDQPDELRNVLAKMQRWLDIFLCSAGGLLVISQPVIDFLYDERYADAGWILQVLCVRTLIACTTRAASSCLVAMGHSYYNAAEQFLNVAGLVAGVVIGAKFGGISGLVWGIALSEVPAFIMLNVALIRHRLFRPTTLLLSAAWTLLGMLVGAAILLVLPKF